jgi:hypothetical protein
MFNATDQSGFIFDIAESDIQSIFLGQICENSRIYQKPAQLIGVKNHSLSKKVRKIFFTNIHSLSTILRCLGVLGSFTSIHLLSVLPETLAICTRILRGQEVTVIGT